MLGAHLFFMSLQLVDSRLPSTREFWRRKLFFMEEFVTDPRCVAEIVAAEMEQGRGVFIPAADRGEAKE